MKGRIGAVNVHSTLGIGGRVVKAHNETIDGKEVTVLDEVEVSNVSVHIGGVDVTEHVKDFSLVVPDKGYGWPATLAIAQLIARKRAEYECASCGRFLPDLNCPGCSFKPRDCTCDWVAHKAIPDEGAGCAVCHLGVHFVVQGVNDFSVPMAAISGYWRHNPRRSSVRK